ncbi:MAG: 4Fe-4S dicluster domain-containing protein [Syntrophorhabdaceae bacterium]|nr:4Fe-4S dicluster domain-containing protein [Syntrophorhabdaceae bacterium]
MRYGMVIDLKRCAGCNSCTIACKAEKGTPPGVGYHRVEKYEVGRYPAARMGFRPIPCMHCKEPACLEVCPTGATYKRYDGLVLVDHNRCMGCRYCVLACPYGARHFIRRIENYYGHFGRTPYEILKQKNLDEGIAVKCDFCVERLERGRLPACVETCPAQARYFGDLDDPKSEVSNLIAKEHARKLKEEFGTEPSVYYIEG